MEMLYRRHLYRAAVVFVLELACGYVQYGFAGEGHDSNSIA